MPSTPSASIARALVHDDGLPGYFLRVQVADPAAYEQWLTTQLLGDPAIARVDSRITMKVIKAHL